MWDNRGASKVLFGGFAEYAIVCADMVITAPETVALSSAVILPVSYTSAMVAFTKVIQGTKYRRIGKKHLSMKIKSI